MTSAKPGKTSLPVPSDTRISKYLSLVLRHAPGKAGLQLDPQGWVEIDALLAGSQIDIKRADIERVVAENDKKRFAISPDGIRIRANQGHSVEVDLALEPATPPDLLYHGTVAKFIDAIQREGLKSQRRHHVHLSGDTNTAHAVGARRGMPIVLTVAAGRMAADGCVFWRSEMASGSRNRYRLCTCRAGQTVDSAPRDAILASCDT